MTEEEVRVGKRTVDAGQVRLRKIVRTEIVNQPVEIRHEDVVIERVSADQVRAGAATSDFKEETIDVPLTREEVVVSKEAPRDRRGPPAENRRRRAAAGQ